MIKFSYFNKRERNNNYIRTTFTSHALSSKSAMPCPPPIQADPIAYFSFFLCNSWTRWEVILEPDAAKGWPKAMAPPLVLVFSRASPTSFSTDRNWAANASFTCDESSRDKLTCWHTKNTGRKNYVPYCMQNFWKIFGGNIFG